MDQKNPTGSGRHRSQTEVILLVQGIKGNLFLLQSKRKSIFSKEKVLVVGIGVRV